MLAAFAADFARARPRWLGYLSTTGVYGDRDGGWVDEGSELTPSTRRGRDRVAAERAWQELAAEHGLPLHIFRLAGIYGPGRGPFAKLRAGTARRIVKPGQIFSRIHAADIAQVLLASPWLVMGVLLVVIGLNGYLFSAITKGFFPDQDNGLLIGGLRADQSISSTAMATRPVS